MPWMRFIFFVSILFTVNGSNHLLDYHLRQFYRPKQINFKEYDCANLKTQLEPLAKQCHANVGFLCEKCGTTFEQRQPQHAENVQDLNESELHIKPSKSEMPNETDYVNEIGKNLLGELLRRNEEPPTTNAPHGINAEQLLMHVPPHLLPPMHYKEFYEDLLDDGKTMNVKRSRQFAGNCDCKVMNDLVDLGHQHFPRYLLNAVCQTKNGGNNLDTKCMHGTDCMPLEYKVKVLTLDADNARSDPTLVWLPDDLRHLWKFKTVTVTAGCFCAA